MSKRTLHGFFGAGASGAGSKKAKKSAAAAASSGAGSTAKPVFIVCPGAGGVLPKDGTLQSQLGRLGRVVVIPKSTGYNGKVGCTVGSKGSLNGNLRIITDAIEREANDASVAAGAPIVLVGQSFGCRAIVHWMSGNHEVRKHPSIPAPWADDAAKPDNYDALRGRIAGVLCFGYPLDHASQDRSAALKRLPADVRALFVMGTSDGQSLGSGLSQSKFEGVLNDTPASTQIIWVDRGGHSPPNSSKWTGASLNTKIKAFLDSAPFAGAGKALGTGAADDGGGKKKAAATPEDVRAKRLAALSGGGKKKSGGAEGDDDDDDDDDDVVVIDDGDDDEKKSE
ncbi:MAG: hypothetical protein ACO3K3_05435 [Schleiferiaceae bacterium]